MVIFQSNIFYRLREWLLFLLLLRLQFPLAAQDEFATIEGIIRDAETNEALVGVNITVEGKPWGTASDLDGYYFLKIPPGTYTLRFEMIGYQPSINRKVKLRAGQKFTLNIYLIQQALEYGQSIEVIGERELSRNPVGSVMDLGPQQIQSRAGALEDVTRTLQTLPGVVSESDFSGRMYVRGGRSDENVVLLDRIYIYEPYHLNGLVSIFNPDLIRDIEFYAGGFPAKYGQALSAVIEVYNRYGRRGPLRGSLSTSLISTSALAEGALPGPRGSFLLSGRVNYYDKIMDLLGLPENYFRPNFHDYQMKLFYPLNKKHLLEINGLLSGDAINWNLDQENEFLDLPLESQKYESRNATDLASIDWKWVLSKRVFAHTNAAYNHQYVDERYVYPTTYWAHFNVKNFDVRSEFTILPVAHHKIETGVYLHRVGVDYSLSYPRSYWEFFFSSNKKGGARLSDDSTRISTEYRTFYQYYGYFLQDEWEIVPGRLVTNLGLRLEYLNISGQLVANPRFSLVYHLTPNTLIKGAWGIFSQYSRDPLVFNPEVGNPTARALQAQHYILGIEHRRQPDYLFRLEGYYKRLYDLITPDPLKNYDNRGDGYSYGMDFFVEKSFSHRWSGWLSYSYGVSRRRDDPSQPYYYPQQDQRHTLSLILNFHPGKLWNLGIKWLLSSGKPYTEVVDVRYVPDSTSGGTVIVPVEGPINGKRFPYYSRLDVRLQRTLFLGTNPLECYLEVLNLLNRKNVYDYSYNREYSKKKAIHQLPFLPVFGVKFSF